MCLLLVAMLTVRIFLLFFPLIYKQFHWLLLVGVSVQVPDCDVNYGLSLTFT